MTSVAVPNGVVPVNLNQGYTYSFNLTQGVIAAIEAKCLENKMDHSILIGILVALSSIVPPGGVFNIWGANEKLWETLIATFIGGAILKAVQGGNYIKKAGLMLLIDTSSKGLTDQIYTLYILGGVNPSVTSYRGSYPEANWVNRSFLG